MRGHGLPTTGDILTQLLPSVEAAKLLQMKKSTAKDADAICELCTHLNPLQVSSFHESGSHSVIYSAISSSIPHCYTVEYIHYRHHCPT